MDNNGCNYSIINVWSFLNIQNRLNNLISLVLIIFFLFLRFCKNISWYNFYQSIRPLNISWKFYKNNIYKSSYIKLSIILISDAFFFLCWNLMFNLKWDNFVTVYKLFTKFFIKPTKNFYSQCLDNWSGSFSRFSNGSLKLKENSIIYIPINFGQLV